MHRRKIKRAAFHLLMIVVSVIMAFPFLYLLKLSLQPDPDVMQLPMRFLPSGLHLQNYVEVTRRIAILQYFWNTVLYAVSTTILTVATAACASYALAKLRLPGARVLVIIFVGSMLLPPEMRAIPMFTLMAHWGWVDSWKGMILPLATTGFAIFFLYQYMITIPDELMDAARIDGASEWRLLRSIIIPISSSAIGTIGLYNFLFRWRDYIWPLVMTKGSVTTMSVGIAALKTGQGVTQWNLISAATMFLFLPSLVLFLGLRTYILRAVAMDLK